MFLVPLAYQWFSTSVSREFLKHAIPDYLVRVSELFFLKLSKKKQKTTANATMEVWCEWVKMVPNFLSDGQKIYFLVCHRILVISLCLPWDKMVANHWHMNVVKNQFTERWMRTVDFFVDSVYLVRTLLFNIILLTVLNSNRKRLMTFVNCFYF